MRTSRVRYHVTWHVSSACNYGAEVRAILESALLGDLDSKVTHWTDSLSAFKMISNWGHMSHRKRESSRYKDMYNAIEDAIARKRKEGGDMEVKWVASHQDEGGDMEGLPCEALWNIEADRLANEARSMNIEQDNWFSMGEGRFVLLDDRGYRVRGRYRRHLEDRWCEALVKEWREAHQGWLGKLMDLGIETEVFKSVLKGAGNYRRIRAVASMLTKGVLTMEQYFQTDQARYGVNVRDVNRPEEASTHACRRCFACSKDVEDYEHLILECSWRDEDRLSLIGRSYRSIGK